MTQALAGGDLNIFSNPNFVGEVTSALADVAITTGATTSSVINFGVAGLKVLKARLRVKQVVASSVGQLVIAVSTTSAMTSPEYIACGPVFAPAATNQPYTFEVRGRSVSGFQYAQVQAQQLSGTAAMTVDASVFAS